MNDSERNWGIDALRIFAMFQIVVIHSLKQGGILAASNDNILMCRVAWFIEVFFFSATNIYALISGYVSVSSKFKMSRIVLLWIQVFGYSAAITLIFQILYPERINMKIWFKAVLPIVSGQYWYVSCYFFLLLFVPIINLGIKSLSSKMLGIISAGMFILGSLLPVVTKFYPINFSVDMDSFGLLNGYSTFWLLILYVLGAYIKKSEIISRCKPWIYILIILLCVAITWESIFFIPNWTQKKFGEVRYDGLLLNNISPTIVITAICTVVLFAWLGKNKCKINKLIEVVGRASLAVYLIHVHPLIWDGFVKNYAVSYVDGNVFLMIVKLFGMSLIIYASCTLIEVARIYIFKLLRIDAFVIRVFDKTGLMQKGLGNEK